MPARTTVGASGAGFGTQDTQPGPRSAIEADHVEYRYPDGTAALADFSLEVPSGQTVGLAGPSGCGKSTFLRLVAGFLAPSSGRIQLDLTGPPSQCPVSMMFQSDTTHPWLTVEQNVLMFARFKTWARGLSRKDLAERAEELLKLVGLEDVRDRYPYQLSGGMKRRLAFATAVAPRPQLLLLDEPFSSVDEPTRVRIHQDVFDITRRLGLTTVLVTHDLAEALTLCDKVHILTRRPARVHTTHHVPFGAERDVLALRNDATFMSLNAAMWRDLSTQI